MVTKTSTTKETLHEGLARIQKTLKAPKGQFNAFSKFNYRSCEDILEAIKPLLNGLVLTIDDEIVMIGNRYYVKSSALLTDGINKIINSSYAREAEVKKGMDEAQITGSASSYARKYALNGLFAIDDTKDADSKDNTPTKVSDPTDSWKVPNAQAPPVTVQRFTPYGEHFCTIHSKPMKERTKKDGGHWYDHRWQDEANEWHSCNGEITK